MDGQETNEEILNDSVDLFEEHEESERRSSEVYDELSSEASSASSSLSPLPEKYCLDHKNCPSSLNKQSSAGYNSTSLLHDFVTTRKKRLSLDDEVIEIDENSAEFENDQELVISVPKHPSIKNSELEDSMHNECPSQINLSVNRTGTGSRSRINEENKIIVKESRGTKALDLTCPLCGLKEISMYRLQFHIETEHLEAASETSSQQTDFKDVVIPNRESQVDPQARTAGMTTVNPETILFTCPLCDLSLEDDVCLEVHVREEHEDELDISNPTGHVPCPLCDTVFTSEEEIQHHIKSHSNGPIYYGVHNDENAADTFLGVAEAKISDLPCPVCGLRFSDSDLLTSHVESHFSPQHAPTANSMKEKTNGRSSSRSASHVSNGRASSSGSHKRPRYETQNGASSSGSHRGNVSYRHQFEQNLERAVMQGEISTSEFYEQRSAMSVKNLRGVDDGHSRVEDGNAIIPSVPRIQEMIESAWQRGFDVQGSQQLNGCLVNTRKWIGGTEIAALLSFLGVRCQIADFHAPSADDGTHPRLIQWVTDYFLEEQEFKPPLYLQHQGHSRTIIGVERDRGTVKLLLFDPGTPKKHMVGLASGALCWKDMKTFRRTQAAFRAKQYQIVAVMGLLSDRDYQSSKVLFSERIS